MTKEEFYKHKDYYLEANSINDIIFEIEDKIEHLKQVILDIRNINTITCFISYTISNLTYNNERNICESVYEKEHILLILNTMLFIYNDKLKKLQDRFDKI